MSKTIVLLMSLVDATDASRMALSHVAVNQEQVKVDTRIKLKTESQHVITRCYDLGCGTPAQERRIFTSEGKELLLTFQQVLDNVRHVPQAFQIWEKPIRQGPNSCGCNAECVSLGICCSDFQATCMKQNKGGESSGDEKNAAERRPPNQCSNVDPEAAKRELQESLSKIFGLQEVKALAHKLISQKVVDKLEQQFHRTVGKKVKGRQNFAFLGPPGTGKTTISKLLSKAFCKLGMVKYESVLEVRPDELIGTHVGQTQKVVRERLGPGLGGVIFIDEAYLLTANGKEGSGNQYQQEAVGVLMKLLDEHQDDTIFIFAGYVQDMEQFFKTNDGLKRRINQIFRFEPFSVDNLIDIMMLKMNSEHSSLFPNFDEVEIDALIDEYGWLRRNSDQILPGPRDNTGDSFRAYAESRVGMVHQRTNFMQTHVEFTRNKNRMTKETISSAMQSYREDFKVEVRRLLEKFPAGMLGKMNGGIVDSMLAGARTARADRILQRNLLDSKAGCLPSSQAIRKYQIIYQGTCPVLLYYTKADFMFAARNMLQSWGADNDDPELTTAKAAQKWFRPYAETWQQYGKFLATEAERIQKQQGQGWYEASLALYQAAYQKLGIAEAMLNGRASPNMGMPPPQKTWPAEVQKINGKTQRQLRQVVTGPTSMMDIANITPGNARPALTAQVVTSMGGSNGVGPEPMDFSLGDW